MGPLIFVSGTPTFEAVTGDELDRSVSLTPEERSRLEAIRSSDSLAELASVMGADTEHDAYLEAKVLWRRLRGKELGEPEPTSGVPGDTVEIDGQTFVVHGITHRNTEPERSLLHEQVERWLEADETVYCEQGIRPMYFEAFPDVCAMDDYRWAVYRRRNLDIESHTGDFIEGRLEDDLAADITELTAQFREAAFSAIESGADIYGERVAEVLGDMASTFLMGHEEAATISDFTSFRLSRRAAADPERLVHLQHYYKRSLLPQSLEREWLRRHDRELELFTHARNERMASYARFHAPETKPVHLIVGAAHQTGVTYYLESTRDGAWTPAQFESIP